MTPRAFNLLAAGFFLLAAGAASASESHVAALSFMVARVQRLQDEAAQGNKASFAALAAAMRGVGAEIAATDLEIWKREPERTTAAIYLLSGGSPRDLLKALADEDVSTDKGDMLLGALAYASGRREQAAKLLAPIDPRHVDPRIAGQLAYIQADLAPRDEPLKALVALDLARTLAPGGLVEEAALRRELFLVAETKDADRFINLSRQYIRRFANSYYYANFKTSFEFNLERLALADERADLSRYKSLLADFPREDRRTIGLTIARAALVTGRFAAAGEAAQTVLAEEPSEAANDAQARLYAAAAGIMSNDYDKANIDLQTLPTQRLKERDRQLLNAALQVAAALRRPTPDAQDGQSQLETQSSAPNAEATIASAEAALRGADAELSRSVPTLR